MKPSWVTPTAARRELRDRADPRRYSALRKPLSRPCPFCPSLPSPFSCLSLQVCFSFSADHSCQDRGRKAKRILNRPGFPLPLKRKEELTPSVCDGRKRTLIWLFFVLLAQKWSYRTKRCIYLTSIVDPPNVFLTEEGLRVLFCGMSVVNAVSHIATRWLWRGVCMCVCVSLWFLNLSMWAGMSPNSGTRSVITTLHCAGEWEPLTYVHTHAHMHTHTNTYTHTQMYSPSTLGINT